MSSDLKAYASCSLGIEAVVARELKQLGFSQVQADNGGVYFRCDGQGLYRANLWLRSAERVYWVLNEFPAYTFEDIYQGVREVPWQEILHRRAYLPVSGNCVKSQILSVRSTQKIVKKAIVDSMYQHYKMKRLPEDGPAYPVKFFIAKDHCTLMLDASGHGLHRRGYRTFNTSAPLRETLAAALIQLSYWNPERELYDPFCGSGTFLIEAAMIGLNQAPGLQQSFPCQKWTTIHPQRVEECREEALDLLDRKQKLMIFGSDIDQDVLRFARKHIQQADLEDRGVFVQTRPIQEFQSKRKYGVMITNPPYGERLEEENLSFLYHQFAEAVTPLMDTWSIYILTGFENFVPTFGFKADRNRKIHNANIPCYYYQFLGPKPPPRRRSSTPRD